MARITRNPEERKEATWLFASPKYMVDRLMSGARAEETIDVVERSIQRWRDWSMTEEEALKAIEEASERDER